MDPGSPPLVPDFSELFSKLGAKVRGWVEDFIVMLPNLLGAVVVVVLFWFVSRWIQSATQRIMHRLSHNRSFSEIAGAIGRVATIAIGLFIALGMLQLDKTVTSLLAGVGVVGLALGFAFQDIAANFMSGFIMAIRRPFDVGDQIETGNRIGRVKKIELRSTVLESLDGLSIVVPNKDIFQHPIVNYTHTHCRRMELTLGTSYKDDLEKVREVTIDAVRDIPDRDPTRDIELFFEGFGDSSINFQLRVWLTRADQKSWLNARSEAMIAIKKAYDREGITIPFPIRTLDFGANAVGGERLDAMRLHVAPPSSHSA